MPKKEVPLQTLAHYLPPGTAPAILGYLQQYHVHLTITRSRQSILGDYRHASRDLNHRISVNGNLNPYAFLITLVHELAHLVTFMEYGNRVLSHGPEWKNLYAKLLRNFLEGKYFPADIEQCLIKSLHNLPASSCADDHLTRILKKYDVGHNGLVLVEDVQEGNLFRLRDGKIFRKGQKLRKRFQCTEVDTGKIYLFSPVYEVKAV